MDGDGVGMTTLARVIVGETFCDGTGSGYGYGFGVERRGAGYGCIAEEDEGICPGVGLGDAGLTGLALHAASNIQKMQIR